MSACAIEWTHCAKEGETCKCDGRVRFGSLPTSSWDDPWALEKMPGSFNASGLLCREATTQAPNTANASGFVKAFPEQKFGAERVCQCGKEQKACLASWILWASPFLISLFSMLFGVMLYFISQSAIRKKTVPGTQLTGFASTKVQILTQKARPLQAKKTKCCRKRRTFSSA